jgi:hypothetical protein
MVVFMAANMAASRPVRWFVLFERFIVQWFRCPSTTSKTK